MNRKRQHFEAASGMTRMRIMKGMSADLPCRERKVLGQDPRCSLDTPGSKLDLGKWAEFGRKGKACCTQGQA